MLAHERVHCILKWQVIQNKIYEIRGYRVILDTDLALMYEVI